MQIEVDKSSCSIAESVSRILGNSIIGCGEGRCGSCSGHVISGDHEVIGDEACLNQDGSWNLCRLRALSNCVVEIVPPSPRVLGVCKVLQRTFVGKNLIKVDFKFPPHQQFDAKPANFIKLRIRGSCPRSYSVFDYCEATGCFSLLLGDVDGGLYSDFFFRNFVSGQIFEYEGFFSGPISALFDRNQELEIPVSRIIFMANGSGLAPFMSVVSERADDLPEVILNWSQRDVCDNFFNNLSTAFSLVEVFNRHENECVSKLSSVTEQLEKYVAEDILLVVCGSSGFCEDVKKAAITLEIPKSRIYEELFY